MRYIVRGTIDPDQGNQLERSTGGPGALIGQMITRFKPQATYFSVNKREFFFYCDLTERDMLEFIVLTSHRLNLVPEFTPVIPGEQFAEVAGPAIAAVLTH